MIIRHPTPARRRSGNKRPGVIGVIGGMGPAATARFHDYLVRYSHADWGAVQDSDYPEFIIKSVHAPGMNESGVLDLGGVRAALMREVEWMNASGASAIVIPCNSVHVLLPEIKQQSQCPVVSIVSETARAVVHDGHIRVGLLASETTVGSGLYDRHFARRGVAVEHVTPEEQSVVTRAILEAMGGGALRETRSRLSTVMRRLSATGAQCVVLGCTELPLALGHVPVGVAVVDSMSVLARAALRRAYIGERTPRTAPQDAFGRQA